jgi:glycosyltransferase involved in cell wall biosynthesis
LPWQYLKGSSPIRKILETEMPDVIEIADKYTLSYLAGFIKKGHFSTLGRPMLIHLSCERMDDNLRAFVSGGKPLRWLAKNVMGNYVAPMFDYHFANSAYTAQELLDAVENGNNGNGSDSSPNRCWRYFKASKQNFAETVFVSNCGVDEKVFNVSRKNTETRRKILGELNISENATVLLYVGRISPEKNIKLLYELMCSLVSFRNYDTEKHDYQLLIAGDGPQKDWLKEKLNKYAPGHFKFFGHITNKSDLADLYANADIFIHPNPREPFGIAPLEAMASGTPVVVPDSGGVLSYANDENAWITEPDVQSYFAAVRDIFSNPERREQRVKKALETVQDFTWEKSFERCFKLYDDLYEEFVDDKKFSEGEIVSAVAMA